MKRYYEEKGKGNEFVKILVDPIEKGRSFSGFDISYLIGANDIV